MNNNLHIGLLNKYAYLIKMIWVRVYWVVILGALNKIYKILIFTMLLLRVVSYINNDIEGLELKYK